MTNSLRVNFDDSLDQGERSKEEKSIEIFKDHIHTKHVQFLHSF